MRKLVIVISLVGLTSCRDNDCRPVTGQPNESSLNPQRNPFHGYPGSRYYLASESLAPLLQFRESTSLTDFDLTIRELTLILCWGAAPNVLNSVKTAPVEQLYPLNALSRCKIFVCGGCNTGPTSYELGRAFAEKPVFRSDAVDDFFPPAP